MENALAQVAVLADGLYQGGSDDAVPRPHCSPYGYFAAVLVNGPPYQPFST